MIYATARFDWLGMECTATLEPEGWKVPESLGVEAALNVVAKLSPLGPMPGSPVDNALESILRIFPHAEIDRPSLTQGFISEDANRHAHAFSGVAQAIA